jgi:hypothetical protein
MDGLLEEARSDRAARPARLSNPVTNGRYGGAPGATPSRRARGASRWSAVVLVMLAALLARCGPTSAATITVDDLSDTTGGGTCTLRDAMTAANSNVVVGGCPAGTPGSDTIGFSVTGTIVLGSMLPAIAEDLSIEGPGSSNLTISGGDAVQVLVINSGVTATVDGLTISHGFTPSGSGGTGSISNAGVLTVSHSTLVDNTCEGGAIYNAGTLTVNDSTLEGNSSSTFLSFVVRAGGISNVGTLTINNSTLSGNTVTVVGGDYFAAGGIFNAGTLTVNNSTVVGNSVSGIANVPPGSLTANNSLIATNLRNCVNVTGGPDNLSDDATCPGFTVVADPMLGPLDVYPPGSTATFALLAGSPAVDAGNDATCTATDQRGVARPQGAHCDIGAFEQTRCGDGVRETGEECDEGLLLNGTPTSCCTSTCTSILPAGCFEPAAPGMSSIALKTDATSGTRLNWKWAAGTAVAPAEFGDPTTSTSYALCVYAGSAQLGMGSVLRQEASAGTPWKAIGTGGFSLLNTSSSIGRRSTSVLNVRLAPNSRRAPVRWKSRVPANTDPNFGGLLLPPPYTGALRVLLRAFNGNCWDATYSAPSTNTDGVFKAKSD